MHIGPEPTTDKFMALFHGGDRAVDSNDVAFASGTFSTPAPPAGFRRRDKRKDECDDDFDDGDGSIARSVVTEEVRSYGRLIKGNTLTVTPNLPFSSLSQFGSAFLNHFVGSSSGASLLRRIIAPTISGKSPSGSRTGEIIYIFARRILISPFTLCRISVESTRI